MHYIDELKKVIHDLHGCEAEYLETVPVKEMFQGQVVWDGEVEVFNLRGHPTASNGYAWAYQTDTGRRFMAVLGLPPVDSPLNAVRAAIMSDAKKSKQQSGQT